MKLKIIIYVFILLIFQFSCKESVFETLPLSSGTPQLKSVTTGKNYFVATTGSDSNAGTLAAPFLTITKGYSTALPGDTVIVKDGTYSSTSILLTLWSGGTAGKYITIKSEHKWGAVLDGGDVATNCFVIYWGTSYVKFQDFEIKRFKEGFGAHDNSHVSSNITIQGCKIHDMGVNMDMSVSWPQAIYVGVTHHDWIINGNLIYNIGGVTPDTYWLNKSHAIYTGALVAPLTAAYNITITDNIIFGVSGSALTLGSNNDLIANNVMAWSNVNSRGGACFITADDGVSNETIANNIFFQPPADGSSVKYAISNLGSFTNWVIKNNMVYEGRMWQPYGTYGYGTSQIAAMAGNNYGQIDCEKPQINPLFVSAIKANAPNVDFNLQSTSPAINAGVDVGLTSDMLGNPIIGLPDIGAYESMVSSAPVVTYYNTQISATATKNDCTTGYTGSAVTYTVAANKYSSTVSQATADNLATTDLNTNKQPYANANGTCTLIPVYYNTQISATATRNNCGTGYTGSTVTYTIAAGKYSSTVSQAAADNLATTDLSANTQNYANTNGTCTLIPVYYNTQISATATKNDCGTGYTGSTVTYTIAAGKYSSTVSQAAADNLATTDLSANTQNYANANGTCTVIPVTIYYNIKMSATATKNDCGTGYTGSKVTYTVAAKTYSSTISQTDANNLASADLNANKQAYANANGTCTRKKR